MASAEVAAAEAAAPVLAAERARDVLRHWVEQKTQGRPSISVPDLAERALQEFPDAFFQRLGRQEVGSLIYLFCQAAVKPSHVSPRMIRLANSMDVRDPEERAAAAVSIMARWFEEVEQGRKVALMEMTRGELTAAVVLRGARAAKELKVQAWLKTLRNRLHGDECVKDKWTAEDVIRKYEEVVE